jgi:hypothetical protein
VSVVNGVKLRVFTWLQVSRLQGMSLVSLLHVKRNAMGRVPRVARRVSVGIRTDVSDERSIHS